jgi:hypothetical protein
VAQPKKAGGTRTMWDVLKHPVTVNRTLRRQCMPGCKGVHIVPPMRDLSVFNLDD